MSISPLGAKLKPSLQAALLLATRKLLPPRQGLPDCPEQILELTGAGRSQAYAMQGRLEELIASLHRPCGRPRILPTESRLLSAVQAVRDYLMEHPGAVSSLGLRRRYTDGFRRFVIGLRAPGEVAEAFGLEEMSEATAVPSGTLAGWFAPPSSERASQPDSSRTVSSAPAADGPSLPSSEPGAESSTPEPETADEVALQGSCPGSSADSAKEPDETEPTLEPPASLSFESLDPTLATIISEWRRWQGTLSAFCQHLRNHLRLPVGRTFVSSILQAAGLHAPQPRNRPPAPWSRGSYRRFFPGAQWLGDGTEVAFDLMGQRFIFNVEAIVDADGGAILGIEVTDSESEQALLEAFEGAVGTAGEPPVGLTVDGLPSNHTAGVEQGIAPAMLVPATPGRGPAKAAVEGAFGLFSQTAPPLWVDGSNRRELARCILRLVFTTWAWARNGRPRKRLAGRSVADDYRKRRPTEEQLAQARAWMLELCRRYRRATLTRGRRADPVRMKLLTEGLARLRIEDPQQKMAIALCRYCTESIVRGLAVFEAKRRLGTVPVDAQPGRYLGGIIRNLHQRLELEQTAERLLELRLRHRHLSLAPLEAELEQLKNRTEPQLLPRVLTDRALSAEALIDWRFFTRAAAIALSSLPESKARAHVPELLRRCAASFKTPRQRREDLIAALSAAAIDQRVA